MTTPETSVQELDYATGAVSSAPGDTSGDSAIGDGTPIIRDKAVTVSADRVGGLSSLYDDDGISISQYMEMVEREPQIKAALQLKIFARMSTGWTIEPASDDPLDVEVADFVSDQFEKMNGTADSLLRRTMLAMAYKLSVHEIVYRMIDRGRWAGRVGWKAIKPKPAETFSIKTDQFGNVTHLEQRQGLMDVKKLDPAYFMVWAWDHDGSYRGKSDLRAAYRWFRAKDHIARFWNIFLEKFAAPLPVGKYPAGANPDDVKKIVDNLSTAHVSKAIGVPENWAVEFLEATREGGDYQSALSYCDRMMGRSMLIPALMLDEGQSGSYSLGKAHSESFVWVLNSLGRELEEEVLGEQLIRRLVDWNWQVDAYPKFRFKPFTSADFRDVAESFCALVDRGIVGRDEDVLRERLNLPVRESGPAGGEAPGGGENTGPAGATPGQQQPPPATDFAQADPPAAAMLKHGKKCNFAEIERTFNELESESMRSAARAIQAMHHDFKKAVRRQNIVETRNTKAVDELRLGHVGELRAALESALGHAAHHGVADGLGEIGRGLAAAGVADRPQPKDRSRNNFSETDFSFSMQEIIAFWDGKVPVQRELLVEYMRKAFTIAGGVSEALLSQAKNEIRKGIIRGAAYSVIESAINDVFEPYYLTEIDPVVGTSARLHNIVRTNMSEAYNTGRMNLYKDPEVEGFVRAFEYSSVLDDRTTDFCRQWHAKVLKKDDPRWSQMLPPNHYQCRSVLIPIVQGEEFEETKSAPGLLPAVGFRV